MPNNLTPVTRHSTPNRKGKIMTKSPQKGSVGHLGLDKGTKAAPSRYLVVASIFGSN